METKYPRFFVVKEPRENNWARYMVVKEKGGKVQYKRMDGSWFSFLGGMIDEKEAEKYLESNLWREVNEEEAALLV